MTKTKSLDVLSSLWPHCEGNCDNGSGEMLPRFGKKNNIWKAKPKSKA